MNRMELEYEHPSNFVLRFSIEQLKQLGSNRKAVSYDLTELKYLRKFIGRNQNKLDVDIERLESLDYLFSMRPIPLNTAHPQLPIIDEFRPIMIQSIFVPKFREIFTLEINPSQIGFVNKMACQYHNGQVIEQLKKKFNLSKQSPKSAIFFDLSNAYDNVDRLRLFQILRNQERYNKYFNPNDLDFLEWIHNSLYIYDPVEKRKVYFKYGFHQGSLLAPFLFDIYFNEIIEQMVIYAQNKQILRTADSTEKEFKQKIPIFKEVKIFAYADDLAIVANHKILNELSIKFVWLAEDFNFQVYFKKKKCYLELKNLEVALDWQKLKDYLNIQSSLETHQNGCIFYGQLAKVTWQTTPSQTYDSNVEYLYQTSFLICFPYVVYIIQVVLDQMGKINKMVSQINIRISQIFVQQDQLKQYQCLISKGDAYQMFLNQQYEEFKVIRRKRLRIQYFPDHGYLDRHKFNGMQCRSCGDGLRWKFVHLQIHNKRLFDQFQELDQYIEERIDKEDVDIDGNYQINFCSQFQILNQNFVKGIEKHGIPNKVNE